MMSWGRRSKIPASCASNPPPNRIERSSDAGTPSSWEAELESWTEVASGLVRWDWLMADPDMEVTWLVLVIVMCGEEVSSVCERAEAVMDGRYDKIRYGAAGLQLGPLSTGVQYGDVNHAPRSRIRSDCYSLLRRLTAGRLVQRR